MHRQRHKRSKYYNCHCTKPHGWSKFVCVRR